MLLHSRDTATHKYKKWADGRERHSKNVCEELACFSTGMSTDMKQKFNFVNIAGNVFYDVTELLVAAEKELG
jgi:hypothetical protein